MIAYLMMKELRVCGFKPHGSADGIEHYVNQLEHVAVHHSLAL